MNKLILVRHGDYDGHNGNLTPSGRERIADLAKRLQPHLTGRAKMISSTAERTEQSAQILASTFGIDHVLSDDLYCDIPNESEYERALELIRSVKDGIDTLVLVTHMYFAQDLPGRFSEAELGLRLTPSESIEKGDAVLVECEQKRLTLFT